MKVEVHYGEKAFSFYLHYDVIRLEATSRWRQVDNAKPRPYFFNGFDYGWVRTYSFGGNSPLAITMNGWEVY